MRNLVIVMAGDESLHERYAAGRDFELWVCYYGEDAAVAERYRQGSDRFFAGKGYKWTLVSEVGRLAREQGLPPMSDYGYVFLPDDDIDFPGGAVALSEAFALARQIGADSFQPAIANDYVSWQVTRQVAGASCRATNIVEIMAPAYSGEVFEKAVLPILHVHPHLEAGWGLEPLIARLAEALLHRPPRTFVLDATPAIHTRPVSTGSRLHRLGRAEKFALPVAVATKMVALARFDRPEAAVAYRFPAQDTLLDRQAMRDRVAELGVLRRFLDVLRSRSYKAAPARLLLHLLARLVAP
ncbi:MAG: hypothetical protein K8H90_03480 [Thermoanaerobaculia bacterium]|nr:hypothetical protein [Thermoanaerobaculia bacterium]